MARHSATAFAMLLWLPLARAEPTSPTEASYLDDLPVVLSASRLPQRLDEAPAAVTVIDHETIRRSGARDIVDVLRLVPGMQVSNALDYSAPAVAYHGAFALLPSQMQVLIDGQSVYSPFLLGSVAPGLQVVALDDIERIEVTRGSNSAAFGARAFLGVVNIVTRHASATHGASLRASYGQNMIADRAARLGWGTEHANFRLSIERQGDDGLVNAFDRNHKTNVGLRADLQLSPRDELNLFAAHSHLRSGRGFVGDRGNPPSGQSHRSDHLHLRWTRQLAAEEEIAVSYAHLGEQSIYDFDFPLRAPFNNIRVDFGGTANHDSFAFQHTRRLDPARRLVWGAEVRREEVRSLPLLAVPSIAMSFQRLLGNLEWRLTPDWLLNAGGMFEHNSWDGGYFAPRLAANWQVAKGHTLRFGGSKGYRPPSLFEHAANVRYELQGILIDATTVARGNVRPESVTAWELGYLGQFDGLSIDVRVFHEQVRGLIAKTTYALPAGTKLVEPQETTDFANTGNFAIRGIEYQLKSEPWRNAQLILGQSQVAIGSDHSYAKNAAPTNSTSLALFQRFDGGIDIGLTFHHADAVAWQGMKPVGPTRRLDLRVAKPVALGDRARGEVALVVQNIGATNQDYWPTYLAKRRAFLSLRIDY